MRTRLLTAALVAVIAAAGLAGCTASGGSTGASVASAGGGASSVGDSASGEAASATAADRSVVTTGSLRLVAESPIRVAARVTDLVEAAGGRVARSTQDPSGRPSADLTLRIPAAAFTRTLDAIEQEGDVRNVSIRSTDVTAKVTEYGVRIANLRTSIARLQELLSTATSSTALVQIEGALTDRQGTLEQLLAEQRDIADQVTYATLSVSVVVPAAAPQAGPADFLGGVGAGAAALVAALGALAVAAGVLLPWAVLLGGLGAITAIAVRTLRRRTRPTAG